MRKKPFTVVILLLPMLCLSQEIGDKFFFTKSIEVQFEKKITDTVISNRNMVYAITDVEYYIYDIQGEDILFSAIPIKSKEKGKLVNHKVYKISKNDFMINHKVSLDVPFLRLGALTLPIKVRFSKGEINFDTNLNLNLVATFRFNGDDLIEKYFYGQIGFGIGSTQLTDTNSSITDSQDVKVLTMLVGLMYEYKGIQLGLYSGLDHINNQSKYNWFYHGNPFISAGIGFNLFGDKKLR